MQDDTIKKMQGEAKKNVNPYTDNTIKALKEEIKIKKKQADDSNKRANDDMKRLKDEANAKAEAQSEVVRVTKMVDRLSALLDLKEKAEKKRSRSREQEEEEDLFSMQYNSTEFL